MTEQALIPMGATEVTKGLTDKEKNLAQAYIGPARYHAAEAARIVGGDPTTAHSIIERPRVQAYIAFLKKEWLIKTKATAKRVIQELEYVALSDITDIIKITGNGEIVVTDFNDLDVGSRKAIKKIQLIRRQVQGADRGVYEEVLSIELHDKNTALRILTKDVLGLGQTPEGGGDGGIDGKKVFGGLTIRGPKQVEEVKSSPDFLALDGEAGNDSDTGSTPQSGPGVKMELPRTVLPSEIVHLSPEEIWD